MNTERKANQRPTLHTRRLKLRPSSLDDSLAISEILGDRAIADTAMHIPHPFQAETAREWISKHPQKFVEGASVDFYVEIEDDSILIGALHIDIDRENEHAELGYYVAQPHWNQGFATEMVSSAIDYGFNELALKRLFAWCLCRNKASIRVLEKVGMTPEGVLRKHIKKWEAFEDIQYFGILRQEYESNV